MLGQVHDCGRNPVRRFIDDDRRIGRRNDPKASTTILTLARKETLEAETTTCESGNDQRVQQRARPGDRAHREPRIRNHLHERGSRIGDSRRTSIADIDNGLSGSDLVKNPASGVAFIVLMHRS